MRKFFLFLILILFIIFIYARYIEIDLFTIHNYDISANVPDSFKDLKIVHFSDTLINEEYTIKDLENLITEINELNPDIIFFTGDLIDDTYDLTNEEQETITTLLKDLEVTLYKFSVIGDNDQKNEEIYTDIMYNSDFILLDNETFILFYKDVTPITITGITDLENLDEAYEIDEDLEYAVNITLTHKPDNFIELDNADIVFAGHYLGGYINFPLYGPIIKKSGSEIYFENYTYENRSLYISNGIGVENYLIRFNNTPSINVYKFV